MWMQLCQYMQLSMQLPIRNSFHNRFYSYSNDFYTMIGNPYLEKSWVYYTPMIHTADLELLKSLFLSCCPTMGILNCHSFTSHFLSAYCLHIRGRITLPHTWRIYTEVVYVFSYVTKSYWNSTPWFECHLIRPSIRVYHKFVSFK